jgi:hypothetical protein
MLMCHKHYKIALFCELSPPLDKSQTLVTVCDIYGITLESLLKLCKLLRSLPAGAKQAENWVEGFKSLVCLSSVALTHIYSKYIRL